MKSLVVSTDLADGADAGAELGRNFREHGEGVGPDVAILFLSPKYEPEAFLKALKEVGEPKVMMGCTSAGEFTNVTQGVGHASGVAIWSTEMKFACALGKGVATNRKAAAQSITAAFTGINQHNAGHDSALILTDALAGHADELIEELTLQTGGKYQFFGGGAGDDANFRRTKVFCGTEVASDAAVGLEILSRKPLGVGVGHGWKPASKRLRVTESVGGRLVSLNAMPAAEVFEAHAASTGQAFDRQDPLPFFLHNILGIDTGAGYKLRVPLAVQEDGSVTCAAEVPTGATVCIMSTDAASANEAAAAATRAALARLEGHAPQVALFFDCVATRLRLGKEFGAELKAVEEVLGDAPFAGCNTYGQVARAEGQFSGFHNCTAVVCVFPG